MPAHPDADRPLLSPGSWWPWRKRLAALVLLVGALVAGGVLWRAAPHDVELVIESPPGVESLSYSVVQGGAEWLGGEAHFAASSANAVHRNARLPRGHYLLRARTVGGGLATTKERSFEVTGSQTLVLPLGEAR